MSESKESPPSKHKYDLGILFVHGIGQQVRGDTLVRFGEPIQQWLQRWLTGESEQGYFSRVVVTHARFTPEGEDGQAPAHASLAISGSSGPEEIDSSWFLAESWWADTFLSPGFRDIATWGFKILPWSLSTHFATRTRRTIYAFKDAGGIGKIGAGIRFIIEFLSFVLALLLFPLVVSLLMIILIIGMLPIPRVRDFAAQLQQMLARTLGDSYVLIASPIQEAVIVGKVERDLRWLLKKDCRRIAVVAHSQGAAVAHAALKKVLPDTGELNEALIEDAGAGLLLVTVGSGLNKLGEIRRIRGRSNPKNVWFAPVGFLLSALSLPEAINSIRTDDMNVYAICFAVLGIGLLITGVLQAWQEFRPSPSSLKFDEQSKVKWLDFYASADPVPNGALYDSPEMTREVMDSRKVYNTGSALFDHTSYWRNDDEFMGQLSTALCDHAGVSHRRPDSLDNSHLAVAAYRRRWRIGWLLTMRLTIFFFTICTIAFNWEKLADVARGPLQALTGLFDNIPLLSGLFSFENVEENISQLLGILVFATLGVIIYFSLYGSWSIWNRVDVAALFERKRYKALGASFIVFVLLFLIVIEAFGLAFMGYNNGIWPGFLAAVAGWLMLSLTVLIIGGVIFNAIRLVLWVLKSLAALVMKIIMPERRTTGKDKSGSADSNSGTDSARRLVDWYEDRSNVRRIWISLCILIAISFPYMAMIASGMTSDQLWGDRWFWEYIIESPEELMSAIEEQSSNMIVRLWQWISGAFLIVAAWNFVGIMSGFGKMNQWFVKIARAEPTALVHARHVDSEEAIGILQQGASMLMEDIGRKEDILKNVTQGVNDEYESIQENVRHFAREAYLIAMHLPVDDQQTKALLQHLARVMPAAAIAWAKRYGREHPEEALALLTLHADQPRWRVRRRVKRALSSLSK